MHTRKTHYRDQAAIAQCDDGTWPCVWFELKRGAILVKLDFYPRYALMDFGQTYGPTLSAGRVADLVQRGILMPAGRFRYRLAHTNRNTRPQEDEADDDGRISLVRTRSAEPV